MPDWNVSNLQLGANLRNDWTVTFVVRNLFDQEAMSYLSNGSNYQSDWFGVDWNQNIRTYQRPRSFALQVRKNWN
jgi:outer membrane receptor protein involved in Fe transport